MSKSPRTNGHGLVVTHDDETCHDCFPLPNPHPLVVGANESLREFRTKRSYSHPRTRVLSLRIVSPMALVFAVLTAFPLAAAAADSDTYSSSNYMKAFGRDFSRLLAAIPPERVNSETRSKAMKGLELIGKAKFKEASSLLNSALQLDPSNSYLQFFNAFDYHMMARAGDTQKYGLAEQGYELAIKFDSTNWIAHYYLGTLYFEQRNFPAAQSELAEVLLFLEDDQEVLFRMVAASYYSHDPVTAAACLDRLRALNPQDAQVLRLSAIISAAIGRTDDANNWLVQYEATKPDGIELASVRERIKHWNMVYRNSATTPALADNHLSDSNQIAPLSNTGAQGLNQTEATAGKLLPVQFSFPVAQPGQPLPGQQSGKQQVAAPTDTVASPSVAPNDGRMVLVDVVLMYTQDTLTASMGMNMLSTLSLQFGSSSAAAYSSLVGDGTAGATSAITKAITVPALTYSLNIANSNSNLNEVLARPTLVALNGMKSEFFSGETLDAAVVSASSSGVGGSVQIQKEIGVKLTITPNFLPDGKIKMAILAERTFLKPPSQNVGFTYKIAVTKVMVDANAVMSFGETLVLGGLSDKEISNVRDGVPFLQDVPVLQYLFSNKSTSDYRHSVLMLITPRKPQYTYRSEEAMRTEGDSKADIESVKELRARYGDWFAPYPNMSSVFHQLNGSSIYREFRTGDVTLEKWDRQETSSQRLKQALGFLFY